MNKCCHPKKKTRIDYLMWGSLTIIALAYAAFLLFPHGISSTVNIFTSSVFEIMNRMWWGLLIGIIFVGILDKIPSDLIITLLGRGNTFSGLFRAVLAGVLLDMCSHGILLVGMKLYQKGASLGQTMAFLIASPWNSFSLTLILWALIGLKWTIAFLILSMVIALLSGMIFEKCVSAKILPENPNKPTHKKKASFTQQLKKLWKSRQKKPINTAIDIIKNGTRGSKMILRWILFGTVIAALVRTFISPEHFQNYFGPTIAGLGLTILIATIMEVCSEGATPLAADFTTRAFAPGNTFAFLMTGVSTDYTEILSIRETTKSWKTAFFLPLITLPQVIALAYILNML